MKIKQLTPEEIETNFNKFRKLLDKLGDRTLAAQALVDHLGERLALAPASGRVSYHSAYAGGLVEHSMRVLSIALRLKKTMEIDVPTDSVVLCCLFHDIGKVGNLTTDYYIPQDSEWHRKNIGETYKHNTEISYMTVPHRSVFLLQHFGVKMTEDEMLGVLLHDGQYAQENKVYGMKEPKLADLTHWADVMATKQEKEEAERD
jgi:putative nucleotidyltransferase with HDIG domain